MGKKKLNYFLKSSLQLQLGRCLSTFPVVRAGRAAPAPLAKGQVMNTCFLDSTPNTPITSES